MQIHATPHHRSSVFRSAARALLLAAAFVVSALHAHAQGCVAARGSGLAADLAALTSTPDDRWEASVSYRWFQSDRHYVGIAYQAQRDAAGDQVINRSNFIDLGLDYTISPRYSVALTIPFVDQDRSQVVKNASAVILERFHTQASGLADISVLANAWVLNPTVAHKGNFQVSLGFVLPSGKHDVTDTFESFDKTSGKIVAVQKAVDESIQPGTGGYGIEVGLNGYRELGAGFTAYADANYTITPQEQNSVGNSISDTYLGRGGVSYDLARLIGVKGVNVSFGLRAEGVMVYDLIGGSNGFRRPGYSVAIDPGITIDRPKWSLRFYLPIAIQRDRMQSYPDKLKTWSTGKYTQGDAAFANYLIQWSYTYKF